MTTVSTGFRPASLRTRKDLCAYCKDPLPAKRRRSREYCSKSCCNRASEERVEVNGRTRPDGLPPFWPLGLEKDFALLGAVRGSVRSVCDELWGLLRRVDAEELEFRRSVETLRGRLLSQLDPHDLLASVERLLAEANKEHAQKLSQLQSEKESVERSSEVSAERSRRLENELAQVRAESTKLGEEQEQSTRPPQTPFQVARLEQFADSVAQKLSQRLIIRVDTSAQTTQLQRLEQGMEAVSQQVAWLIKNPPQPVAPTINWKLVQTALQLVYEQVRGMRTETNLIPIHSALNEISINEAISTVACGLHSGGSIRSVRDRLKVGFSTSIRITVRLGLGHFSVRRGLMRCSEASDEGAV